MLKGLADRGGRGDGRELSEGVEGEASAKSKTNPRSRRGSPVHEQNAWAKVRRVLVDHGEEIRIGSRARWPFLDRGDEASTTGARSTEIDACPPRSAGEQVGLHPDTVV